jgi:hypothetical protein
VRWGARATLELLQHNVSLNLPIWQDSRDEWSLSARVRLQDCDTRAVLPDTGEGFPGELWDIRAGVSSRHKFDNDWIAAGGLTIGSASDEPFASEHELIGRAIGLLRVPRGGRDAWLFTLIYASDEDVLGLGAIPVPGVAYLYAPGARFTAVIGVPFSPVEYRPIEPLTLELTYSPVREFRARATYRPFRPLPAYLGFDWDSDHHFRADRGDKDDRLFSYEKRVTGGIRFDLRYVFAEVRGGYAFDRFYFEGESYSDRRENRIDVGATPFAAVRVGVHF